MYSKEFLPKARRFPPETQINSLSPHLSLSYPRVPFVTLYHIALDGACAVGAKAVYGRHEFQGVHVFVAFVVEGRSPRGGEFGHCLGRRCEDGRCRPCAILFYFVICSIIPKTMAASNPKISFRFRIGGWGGRGGGVFNTICVYYIWLFITLTGAVFGVR